MLRVDRLMREKGLTNKRLALASGIDESRMSNLRRGKGPQPGPDGIELRRCARVLGWPVADAGALLDEVDDTEEAARCGPGV